MCLLAQSFPYFEAPNYSTGVTKREHLLLGSTEYILIENPSKTGYCSNPVPSVNSDLSDLGLLTCAKEGLDSVGDPRLRSDKVLSCP
jgi:hypothetical protein